MPSHAVTIDFWNTLVDARIGGAERRQRRLSRLASALRSADRTPTEDETLKAYETAIHRFDVMWRTEHRTPDTGTLVGWIWDALSTSVPASEHDATVTCFQDVLLEHPPAFADGSIETLTRLADRASLIIISDTMLSPGRTIRQLLDRRGVLGCFSGFVFSDETGFSKPDPAAFAAAASIVGCETSELLHVGDLRRTDVAGAVGCGARALWYTGIHRDADPYHGPPPESELASWRDLERHL